MQSFAGFVLGCSDDFYFYFVITIIVLVSILNQHLRDSLGSPLGVRIPQLNLNNKRQKLIRLPCVWKLLVVNAIPGFVKL